MIDGIYFIWLADEKIFINFRIEIATEYYCQFDFTYYLN